MKIRFSESLVKNTYALLNSAYRSDISIVDFDNYIPGDSYCTSSTAALDNYDVRFAFSRSSVLLFYLIFNRPSSFGAILMKPSSLMLS